MFSEQIYSMPCDARKLDIEGFNGSILKTSDGYIGLVRRCKSINTGGYPQCDSSIHFFQLSQEFLVVDTKDLRDNLERERHISWASGLEDPRILTHDSCLCVTLDTNTEWKAEISYVKFDVQAGLITKIQPLKIDGLERRIEKNWIVIDGENGIILHSMKPLTLLKVNLETGQGHVLYKNPDIYYNAHNGSSVKLSDGSFLLSIRIKDTIHYKESLWIKMRADYTIESVSPPYRFINNEFRTDYTDHVVYEMCMSLHIEDGIIIACVGMNDTHTSIYKIPLQYILENLVNICST